MMKEYFIAIAILIGNVCIISALCYFSGCDYNILLIEFMLFYLVINKLSDAIRQDKKEK